MSDNGLQADPNPLSVDRGIPSQSLVKGSDQNFGGAEGDPHIPPRLGLASFPCFFFFAGLPNRLVCNMAKKTTAADKVRRVWSHLRVCILFFAGSGSAIKSNATQYSVIFSGIAVFRKYSILGSSSREDAQHTTQYSTSYYKQIRLLYKHTREWKNIKFTPYTAPHDTLHPPKSRVT